MIDFYQIKYKTQNHTNTSDDVFISTKGTKKRRNIPEQGTVELKCRPSRIFIVMLCL